MLKYFRMWVQRVLEFTGWEPSAHSVDWESIEGELQAPPPADYKELIEAFGGGTFSESVHFLAPSGPPAFDFLTQWRAFLLDPNVPAGQRERIEDVTWGS